MIKDDKIQLRLTKGTKLTLDLYCKNKGLKISNLYEMALREYFISKGDLEIYSIISLADKYFYTDKMEKDDIVYELMANDLYEKLMNRD